MRNQKSLSRRERQIMDIIYEMKEATALQVMERLPSPPGYSAVRALLRVLENKGHLSHRQDGARYVYTPILAKEKARRGALRHLLKTFFDNSTEDAVAALLDMSEDNMSEEEYQRLYKRTRHTFRGAVRRGHALPKCVQRIVKPIYASHGAHDACQQQHCKRLPHLPAPRQLVEDQKARKNYDAGKYRASGARHKHISHQERRRPHQYGHPHFIELYRQQGKQQRLTDRQIGRITAYI